MRPVLSGSCCAFALVLPTSAAFADAETNGRFGINIPNVGLDGSGIDIGQAEVNRPGDPDFDTDAALYHSSVNPTQGDKGDAALFLGEIKGTQLFS
jgi:hypothetical protein